MSNVNSEDPGGYRTSDASSGGGSGGGSHRVEQVREEQTGRGIWPVIGTIVVTALLLMAPIWIVAEMLRVRLVARDSNIVWLYAAVLVLLVAGALWFLFRVIRQQRGDGTE